MKKSVLISLIALGVSLVGLVIALAAWMRKKKELCCDDFDDDLLMDDDDSEYIAAQYVEHADEPLADEDASSDAVAEHAKLKQRLAAAEEEWFLLTEELEEEMARQAEQL